jgi:hypothetical protein
MSSLARFPTGKIVATRQAGDALVAAGVAGFVLLERHVSGDWGDVSSEAREENDRAVQEQLRITSTYTLNGGVKIWVMTEADRSTTTILLPQEYPLR